MRVLFIIAVVVSVFGFGACTGGKAYIDLRKPIYMVTEDSFFTGCEEDPAGMGACRESRIQVVRAGVMQWLDYFEEDTRPFVGIVSNIDSVPYGTANQPIRLRVKPGGCDEVVTGESVLACYYSGNYFSWPRINFTSAEPDHITSNVVAHEFGHALGLDHYDNADGSSSIMTASVPPWGQVMLSDIDRLCKVHRECPARKGSGKRKKAKK